MTTQDKEARKLTKVKIDLLRNPKTAMWRGLLMVGSTSISDDVPTAYTNGRDEVYGRQFVRDLNDKQLAFVIMHETMHKAFRHLTTWQKLFKENAQLANMACDYVGNLILVRADPKETYMAFPRGKDGNRIGLYDERFTGMHAKQVFDILKREQQAQGNGKGQPGKGQPGKGQPGSGHGGFDEHDWEAAAGLSEEEKKELEREIDQALRQGKMLAGKMAGDGSANNGFDIEELLTPKIDWREALREFVKSTCAGRDMSSWRRPNRRFLAQDMFMPTLVSERVKSVAIAVDMSGSTWVGDTIQRFMSEAASVFETVKPEAVDMIYWDTRVCGHEVYGESEVQNIIGITKPVGGGGTDPRAISDYMREKGMKPDCVIVLTDGEVPNWGSDWESPVLWVIANDHRSGITADNGVTIHID